MGIQMYVMCPTKYVHETIVAIYYNTDKNENLKKNILRKAAEGYQESKHVLIERLINGNKISCMGSQYSPLGIKG